MPLKGLRNIKFYTFLSPQDYRKKLGSCTNDDLPEDKIKTINLSGNTFPPPSSSSANYIKANLQTGYSSALVDKFEVVNNTVSQECECTDAEASDPANPTETEKINMKLVKESKCMSMKSGMPLIGE